MLLVHSSPPNVIFDNQENYESEEYGDLKHKDGNVQPLNIGKHHEDVRDEKQERDWEEYPDVVLKPESDEVSEMEEARVLQLYDSLYHLYALFVQIRLFIFVIWNILHNRLNLLHV